MTAHDLLFKVLLLGDHNVGKSRIIVRYAQDSFDSAASFGVDFRNKTIALHEKKINMLIWDTPGHERFRDIVTGLVRSCMGVMLVYDITNQKSFDSIAYWMKAIKQHGPDVEVLLVGNKCDLDSERVISTERGQLMASSLGISFREISPKSGITNVDEAFDTLARCLLAKVCMFPKTKKLEKEHKKIEDEEKKMKAAGRSDRCSTM